MKNQIIFLIFAISFLSFVSAIQQPLIYYKLNLDYSYGNISINSTQVEFSDEPIDNVFGFYSVSIFDSDGKILNLTLFDIPNEILYDTADENGTINGGGFLELNQTNFDIFVPYNSNAKDVVVYDENNKELSRNNFITFWDPVYSRLDLIRALQYELSINDVVFRDGELVSGNPLNRKIVCIPKNDLHKYPNSTPFMKKFVEEYLKKWYEFLVSPEGIDIEKSPRSVTFK